MNYNRKYNLRKKISLFLLCIAMVLFISVVAYSCEMTFDYTFLIEKEKNKNLLRSHIQKNQLSDSTEQRQSFTLINYLFSCFSFLFPMHIQSPLLENSDNNGEHSLIISEPRGYIKRSHLRLPPEMILKITTFLDPFSQLKLSQVNKVVRLCIEENFWAKQIQQERYYIWSSSVSKAQVFFANYFYHYGFGKHPTMPERVIEKREDITLLPNIIYAERALALGFPKGHTHYRQAQHKECMLKVDKKVSQTYTKPSYVLSIKGNKFDF